MAESKRFKVGVTIHPQQCTIQELRDAWRRADGLGVDSIWFWDHFFPLYGNPNGNQFECWSLLAACALDTRAPQIGPMVSCAGDRNPDLLAYVAGTVGRDPKEIERTANIPALTAKEVEEWLGAGLQHFVLRMAHPFGTKDVERMIKLRDS